MRCPQGGRATRQRAAQRGAASTLGDGTEQSCATQAATLASLGASKAPRHRPAREQSRRPRRPPDRAWYWRALGQTKVDFSVRIQRPTRDRGNQGMRDMRRKLFIAVVMGLGVVTTAAPAIGATHGELVRESDTAWSTPSTDPTGLTYDPRSHKLWISDSEVDETGFWKHRNLFFANRRVGRSGGPGGSTKPRSSRRGSPGTRAANPSS